MLTELSREQLHALVPHAGAMCLINRVTEVDVSSIAAVSDPIDVTSNPLSDLGKLNPFVIVEYAAQVAALHITQRENSGLAPGANVFLAAVKNLSGGDATLQSGDELVIDARCLSISTAGAMYEFNARVARRQDGATISGRFSLMVGA